MSLPFMRLPLLAFLLLGSLLPVLASLSVAGGEPDAVTRGYNYFSQFCMEKFPDIGEIERAMDQAGWKRIFATPKAQSEQKLFIGHPVLGEQLLLPKPRVSRSCSPRTGCPMMSTPGLCSGWRSTVSA